MKRLFVIAAVLFTTSIAFAQGEVPTEAPDAAAAEATPDESVPESNPAPEATDTEAGTAEPTEVTEPEPAVEETAPKTDPATEAKLAKMDQQLRTLGYQREALQRSYLLEREQLRGRVATLEEKVADIDRDRSFQSASVGLSYLTAGTVSVNGTLGPLAAGYVFGHGGMVGIDIFRHHIGRVYMRFLGIGAMFYQTDGAELSAKQYARSVDMVLKPLQIDVRLWESKNNSVAVALTGAVSWFLPEPGVASREADKQLAGIGDTPDVSNLPTQQPTFDPANPQGSIDQTGQQAADQANGMVNAKVEDVKSKTDNAFSAAGDVYAKAFAQPVVSIGLQLMF